MAGGDTMLLKRCTLCEERVRTPLLLPGLAHPHTVHALFEKVLAFNPISHTCLFMCSLLPFVVLTRTHTSLILLIVGRSASAACDLCLFQLR